MQKLNLPEYPLKFKEISDKLSIFDPVRKRYVVVTPEEWVRQNFLLFLINDKKYPPSLLAVEKKIVFNTLTKRCDIVLYNNKGEALLIVECKAPDIDVSQKTFDQIARYNMKLKVNYLVVTNGLKHYCCFIDFEKNDYRFLEEIPDYNNLIKSIA
jgi:hypothetical protein